MMHLLLVLFDASITMLTASFSMNRHFRCLKAYRSQFVMFFLAYVKYPKLVKISFEFHSKRQTRSFKIKHNADRKFFKKFLLELK